MRIKFIYIILIFLFFGCNNHVKNKKYENKYDILILYNYCKKEDKSIGRDYLNRKYLRDGNLYLIFESKFKNDTVEIKINNKRKLKEVISTEPSAGLAKEFKFEEISKINTVGIRINNGKEAKLEIDTMNFFLIKFQDSILNIRVPKNVPTYE